MEAQSCSEELLREVLQTVSRLIDLFLHRIQRVLAWLSLRWPRTPASSRVISWVVGPVEVASMVANFARAIPDSFSVTLAPHRFYSFSYDFQIGAGRGDWLRRLFVAPWVFGRLAATSQGFVYVGAEGFLLNEVDDREWEFSFLRRHGVRIVCLFAGSDIRSPVLMRRFQEETGLETIATYLDQVSPVFATASYDHQRYRTARVADKYADLIFNAAADQLSYLQRTAEPFPYFFPDEDLLLSTAKHDVAGPRIVVHAPSSPIIKGTQVVRAAVRRLQAEGFVFEYRELLDLPHGEVIESLREAHIVLNEFYAFMPGVFGIEAMASNCALLTRADEKIETGLPPDSNSAWIVTTASDLYLNLRQLLSHPHQIAPQAAAGLAWVQRHATVDASGKRIRDLLDRIG